MPKTPQAPAPVTGGMSFGGGFSTGIVIMPPAHPDDRPWPQGMVIKPPDVNDQNTIVLGTDHLAPAKPVAESAWSKQVADAIHDGLGAITELVLPSAL
jgi:hypothetical protein